MIKELVKDEAILSTPCEPATAADAEIAQDLVDTLLSIEDAACLAATPMIKELVKDEAILSTPCEPATAADAEIAQDLVDTLLSIEDAACLAANQIGVTKAICALADDEGNTLVMYNPKVLFGMGAFKAEESCLTREGSVRVTRFVKIKVAYDELVDGELKPRNRDFVEWPAELIQHMCDHCQGKLV